MQFIPVPSIAVARCATQPTHCCAARTHATQSDAFSSWPRCSRHTCTAAGRIARTGTTSLAERDGTQAAFDALAPYADDPRLADYQPYWAARANLVSRAGARAKALGAYALAIGLERDPAVRRFLLRKRMELSSANS